LLNSLQRECNPFLATADPERPSLESRRPSYRESAALAGLAITPLPASALVAGLRIPGVEEGLPPLPDLEFAIYEKARPDRATAALAAVLLAQGPSRPAGPRG
jgi:DNA-binding transcriptional LysR family regulator